MRFKLHFLSLNVLTFLFVDLSKLTSINPPTNQVRHLKTPLIDIASYWKKFPDNRSHFVYSPGNLHFISLSAFVGIQFAGGDGEAECWEEWIGMGQSGS